LLLSCSSFFRNQDGLGKAFLLTRPGFGELTKCFFSSCTTLNVYCKSFNVLVRVGLRSGAAEKLCKVTNSFSNRQIFRGKISNFFSWRPACVS